jgi:hypothetical protein
VPINQLLIEPTLIPESLLCLVKRGKMNKKIPPLHAGIEGEKKEVSPGYFLYP